MMTLNDGRSELWQWDTGRTLAVDADCSQVHFSNKVFGRSIDVDVIDGTAIIPDVLLQTDKDLNARAFVGTAENGYTKISKTFKVNRRNKPAGYVFTPVEQTTIAEIAAIAQSVRDDADAGLFDGAQGPAGAGVPDGGTAGQLLSKTEYGTEWIDPPQSKVQPDWNQNDSTAADYVKNRPFYTGTRETVLVEESTVSFDPEDGIYIGELESTFSATVGETYKVYWDGTAYECICVDFSGMTIIGNLSIANAGSDTGEPFFMNIIGGMVIGISTLDTSDSHTFSISGYAESVVKIDQKYLPVASETEPGIISVTTLSDSILQQVKNEYFMGTDSPVSGYTDATTIKECADKNNSYSIFSPKKFSGAVLSCYNNAVNKYITFVLSGGNYIECWKSSQDSTTMEQLWGISKDGIVISSSTADSTKKFRITVDDSGTLKATEVT